MAKAAAMTAGRYAHAKQFKRHQRQLRTLRSRLGQIIRDIRRKIEGRTVLEEVFALSLIIGHMKAEGHLGRCHLKGRTGDAANVILSAVGHSFRRILAWLREFLALFLGLLWQTLAWPPQLNPAS